MQSKRGELVPIAKVLSDLGGPVGRDPRSLAEPSRSAPTSRQVAGLGSALPVWILASHVNACQRLLCPFP